MKERGRRKSSKKSMRIAPQLKLSGRCLTSACTASTLLARMEHMRRGRRHAAA
jgi:putative intracellular protease/amidase